MAEKKVEHVSGGEPRTFSAIKGQGKAGKGPAASTGHEERPAIVKIWPKNNKGE